ncbi:hypothetical protein VNO77_30892 [Canavalia gladiata]|uniref:Uncharacterized protein n=1 Tax=Canavalia gladiata TaxID=3824 RepID=A0AAN9KR93_CANGL
MGAWSSFEISASLLAPSTTPPLGSRCSPLLTWDMQPLKSVSLQCPMHSCTYPNTCIKMVNSCSTPPWTLLRELGCVRRQSGLLFFYTKARFVPDLTSNTCMATTRIECLALALLKAVIEGKTREYLSEFRSSLEDPFDSSLFLAFSRIKASFKGLRLSPRAYYADNAILQECHNETCLVTLNQYTISKWSRNANLYETVLETSPIGNEAWSADEGAWRSHRRRSQILIEFFHRRQAYAVDDVATEYCSNMVGKVLMILFNKLASAFVICLHMVGKVLSVSCSLVE